MNERNVQEKEAIKEIIVMYPLVASMVSHINSIAEEPDAEIVSAYIDAIQETRDALDKVTRFKHPESVKDDIRNGRGDFSKIQGKCIAMGLV